MGLNIVHKFYVTYLFMRYGVMKWRVVWTTVYFRSAGFDFRTKVPKKLVDFEGEDRKYISSWPTKPHYITELAFSLNCVCYCVQSLRQM
jgi:hypothetical protein